MTMECDTMECDTMECDTVECDTVECDTMPVVDKEDTLRQRVRDARREGRVIGLVPTMGALHIGHLSLIETARRETDFVVVTVFVNPSQFGPQEDFREYPRPLETDLAACREAGVDLVFHPAVETIYPTGFDTSVTVGTLSERLEGAFRPGHFRGVSTIVMKLLQLTQPDVAFFGRKDYQQQLLIRTMCRDLNVPVEIRTCPTVRDPDGLAVSSRNQYLSAEDRSTALALSRCLKWAETQLTGGAVDVTEIRAAMRRQLEELPGVQVDYATVAHPETLVELAAPLPDMVALVAARVGSTRLIDNLPIRLPFE